MSASQTSLNSRPGSRSGTRTPRVRTLDRDAFAAACASLMQMVAQECHPDLLIGIRTGGLVVAEAMARSAANPPPVLPLTSRRAGTATKSRIKWLPALLRRLPGPIVDLLRVVEHRMLSHRRRTHIRDQYVDAAEAEQIFRYLQQAPPQQTVLVVDDAVDSGATLAAVLRLLRARCGSDTRIRAAVITMTLEQPVEQPDYALYRGVLCRFPWSFDAAN